MKNTFINTLLIVMILLGSMVPVVYAAEITDRSLSLSSSAPGTSANYTFNLSAPSSTPIKGFEVEICDEAVGACTVPAGFDASVATLINQPSGFGDSSGWNVDTSSSDVLRMNHPTNNTAPGSAQTVTFGSVVNPTTANETFFARITTYENDDYTEEIDSGVVAASTAETITITGFVPPILTFCVGINIPSDCSSASGNSLDLGAFSPNSTISGTSQMRASTNAGDGYVITVNGTTLASGSHTIDALSSPSTSQTGVSQFGLNLRDNSNPDVGSNPSGSGTATLAPSYGTVNQFTFNNGDIIAESSGPTNFNTFTASYIVNIAPQQAAGNYTTTLTYICTATF